MGIDLQKKKRKKMEWLDGFRLTKDRGWWVVAIKLLDIITVHFLLCIIFFFPACV